MLSSTTTKTPRMVAASGQTTFPYTGIKILSTDQLEVYVDDVLQTSGYSLPGVPTGENGGTIVFSTPMVGDEIVQARRVPPLTQTGSYTEASKFNTSAHELNLDKLAMQIQYLDERVDRALKWAFGSTLPTSLPNPTTYSGYVLGLNSVTGLSPIQILTTDIANPLTTAGDMLYHDGNSPVALPYGPDGAMMMMNGTTQLPFWSTRPTYTASQYAVPANSSGDVRTNLQNILDEMYTAGGGVLELTQNATYHISSTLIIPTNTYLKGNGATIKAHSSWSGSRVANTSSLIRNYNHGYLDIPASVTSLTDTNIIIENLHFDYDGQAAAGEGNICIWLRYVDRYLVRNCTFTDCGDATGMLACRDGLTDHCYADGFINAAFDHWDGCIDCGVTHCTVRSTLTDTAQGIQFTGTGSSGENRDTVGCYAAFNKVYGVRHTSSNSASAIIFNANDADSSVSYGLSLGNYIEDSDLGVVFSGAGGYLTSMGDTLKDVTYAPMFMQHANSDSPNYCRFVDTTLIDCDNISGSALVTITGTEPEVRGLKVISTATATPYPYIVNITSTSTDAHVEITTAPDGSSGRVLNNGVTSRIYNESIAYTPVLAFGGASTGITYTSRDGFYTRVGDLIYVGGYIDVNSNGTATGSATISLPVACKNILHAGLITVQMTGASGLTSQVIGNSGGGLTTTTLYDNGSTGRTALDENNIPDSCAITFTGVYRVDI